MSVFRFATVAIAMSLTIPFGSTPAATSNPPPPPNHLVSSQTLDLRAVGSQLVVDTIEDALRQGGLALFEEGFQFESSLNWIFGESIEGEVDVVVPLWSEGGQALFVQPGAVFWTGLAEEERIDGNFGAVYRTELFDSFIGGGSVFYDYDFQYGHSRLGAGVDLQSGLFQAGFNYYHPLDEWDEGRTDYEEQALRGVDFRIALEREVMRLGANLSYWRFEGEEDEKGDWKPSYGFDAGIRIVPGVFLEGGWEGHDETVSLDQRWNAGLAFRFSLPDFKGASYGEGGLSSNLWKFVEREKRILYEERLGIPRVNLTDAMYEDEEDERAGGVAEGNTVTIPADIGKPLDEDVMLHIMIAETSTAVLGTDFTYAHRVYELNEATGAQSAPEGDATPCAEALCEVMIPAGVTRFDIEADILADNDAQEVPKSIDFQVEVPEEYAGLVRGSFVEQVTLRGHGNTVQFASAESTLNEDPDTPEGTVAVSVNVELPSPVSITLNVGATDDAATAMIDRDYRISTRSLTIPANASSASLTLEGINNDVGEGSKTIELTLSGDLPDGWAFGSRTTHTVTLQDDDLAIFFTNATRDRVEEPDSNSTSVTITVGITQAPTAEIKVMVADGGTGQTAQQGNNNDYTFSAAELTFASGSEASQTTTLMVLSDNDAEPDQTIILTLADVGGSVAAEGSGFSLGGPHTITIPANDNTVAFASPTSTLTEGANTMTNVAVNVNQSAPVPITLNVDVIGTTDPKAATEGTDYENLPDSLTIGARQSSGTITLRGREDELSEGNENIMLEISVPSGSSLPSGWALGSQTTHMVTLQDNDLVVGFAEARQVIEESSGVTTKSVPITINQAPSSTIEFDVIVTGEGEDTIAMTTGSAGDYVVAINAVSFPAQQTGNRNVTVNINNDNDAELEERVVLTLREKNNSLTNSGFSLGQATHTIVIPPNDNTVSLASTSGATLGEEGGTATVTVNVNKVAPSNISLTVTGSGDAVAGTDYTLPGTLTINAGRSSGEIMLTGMTDTLREGSEGFTLTFAGNLPDGWGFVNTSGTSVMSLTHEMTLVDDDLVTGFVSSTSMAAAPASFGTFPRHDIQVSLPSSPAVAVTLTASKTGGNAVVGGVNDVRFDKDSVTFPANATGSDLTQIISIAILDPGAAGKTLEITLMDSGTTLTSGSNNFTLDSPTHTVTITSP